MRLSWFENAVAALVLLAASGCSTSPGSKDSSPHQRLTVSVSDGVDLELLDWGGDGTALVFLAGLGNTAHVFDGFAPRFTHRSRVFAITRRGFGRSSDPRRGYGIDTLVQDMKAVLDTTGVERCVLVGHSFAGDEMTRFASAFPERVIGIVYLDAAHDRVALRSLGAAVPYPSPPEMTTADSASIEGLLDYLNRYRGVYFPTGELEAAVLKPDASPVEMRQTGEVVAAVLNGILRPDYSGLRVPILAVFAVPSEPVDMFPYLDGMNGSDMRKAQRAWEVFSAWEREEIARFRRSVPSAAVEVIHGANHFVFLSHADTVAEMILEFLDRLQER